MSFALSLGQKLKREVEIMEFITNWEAFNTASLAFCQVQGLLGIIIISGIVVFKYNLGGMLLSIIKSEGRT